MKKSRTKITLTVTLPLIAEASMPDMALGVRLEACAFALRAGKVPPKWCRQSAAEALQALVVALKANAAQISPTRVLAEWADVFVRSTEGMKDKPAIYDAMEYVIKPDGSGLSNVDEKTYKRVLEALRRLRGERRVAALGRETSKQVAARKVLTQKRGKSVNRGTRKNAKR